MHNQKPENCGANQNTERLLVLIETMAGQDNALRLSDVAKLCGMNVSTASRILASLQGLGYVMKDAETSRYSLTCKICRLGYMVKQHEDLGKTAMPFMKKLSAQTRRQVNLFVREEYAVRCICSVKESSTDGGIDSGDTVPLYCSDAGKVFLCAYFGEKLNKYLNIQDFVKLMPNTISSADELRRELLQVNVQGYATDNEEYRKGVCGIAAGIKDYSNRTIAALSLSCTHADISQEKLYLSVNSLIRQTTLISGAMGYDGREEEKHYRR